MARKILAQRILSQGTRSVIETLESRMLLSAAPTLHQHITHQVVNVGNGGGSIYGTVYEDLNANQIQDPNESVVVGATVYIDLNNSGALTGNDPQTVTDAFGGYGFTGLADGTYTIRIIPLTGFHMVPPGFYLVTISNGDRQIQEIPEVNQAIITPTTVTGTVFEDVDQDGLLVDPPLPLFQPFTKPFLAGDTVYVDLNHDGQLDPGDPSTTTNNTGQYSFTLQPGTYDLRVIPRPGFHQDPPGYYQVTLADGNTDVANIGENNTTTITGTVFLDSNGNGVQDAGEIPLANEEVYLDLNFSGQISTPPGVYNPVTGGFDSGDPHVVTNAAGQYTFSDLPPGAYRVETISQQNLLVDNPSFDDIDVTQGQLATVNVGEGLPCSVSGTVFNDANGSGVLTVGDAGLLNAQVYADVNNNGVYDSMADIPAPTWTDGLPLTYSEPSAFTDVNGNYTIAGLPPGTYTLRLNPPSGVIPTSPTNQSHSYTFTLASGQNINNENFGYSNDSLGVTIQTISTKPTMDGVTQHATFQVTNLGSTTVQGLVGINLFASVNQQINTNTDTLVGFLPGTNMSLRPGQSRILKMTYEYPQQLATGEYFLSAQVVSSYPDLSAKSLSTSIGPVTITAPFVQLVASYTIQPALEVDPGQQTPLSLTVTNTGNVTSTGLMDFRIYTSLQNQLEPDDVVVQDVRYLSVKLAAGKTRVFNFNLRNPGFNLGSRYIIVYLDSGDPLGESNIQEDLVLPLSATYFA